MLLIKKVINFFKVKKTLTFFAFVGCALPVHAEEEFFYLDTGGLRAQIVPSQQAILSSEMIGRISDMAISDGSRVAKGDALVSFECGMQNAQLKKSLVNVEISENIYNGNKRLKERQAIGTVELEASLLEVKKARADLEFMDATVRKCEIKAPFDGFVFDLKKNNYEFVQVGEPLFELIDDSLLRVEFIAPAFWAIWLKKGFLIKFELEDTKEVYDGVVKSVAEKVDVMSQSIEVVADLILKNRNVRPGMSGRILIKKPDQ